MFNQEDVLIPFNTSPLPSGPWIIVAPHADDETFGMGGTLLKAKQQGIETHLVVLTDGSQGGRTDDLVEVQYLDGESVPTELLVKDKNGDFIYAEQIFGAPLTGQYAFRYNEYGHTTFSNFFYFITGFHGFHVFTGVLINIVIFINVLRGVYHRRGHYEMVEKVGLYWHFVDLVWVFVFTFFYLV